MKSNFHTHTSLCKHAYGTAQEYAESAFSAGLDILGFSDHAPFPDKDFGLRMEYDQFDGYIKDINKIKELYTCKMKVYNGLEIEYLPCYDEYYRKLTDKNNGFGLDYLILGEHFYGNSSDNTKNIFFAESTDDYIEYAKNIRAALSTGLFSVCAHPDIMFINEFRIDRNCQKACDIILSSAEQYCIPIEFNANGIRRGIRQYIDGSRYPYPYIPFWESISGSKIKVVIGSDCHSPDQIWDDSVKTAYEICNKLKLNILDSIF